ncbi:hypothetical protein WT27_12775 [Burkholderia territorii]|uniref:Uncharacterized protein n=2 Tax=Burkholderia territorii TaxID=1503055 RepID=A0A105V421_9BURK|nr:hypothetical protein WT27_12775 [Burkholderia territorii]KVX33747.1 hypothetical protein WT31_08675 [Burkholderia territorii]
MLRRFGHKVSPNGKLERRIVANLIAHLEAGGFQVIGLYDGDDLTAVTTAKEAMELIFNLDEASLRIGKAGTDIDHGILLIVGNGIDIVSDYTYSEGDSDGFSAVMGAFDAEAFA